MKRIEKLFVGLCFFAFITPNFIVKINMLNNIAIITTVLCFGLLAYRTIKKEIKLDPSILLLLLWRLVIFILTLLNHGEILKCGYQSVAFVGLYLLIKNYINSKEAYKVIYKLVFSYVLINMLLSFILPDGLFPEYGIHFLGIRTRFTEYSIALIYISLFYFNCFSKKKKNDKILMIASVMLAIINIFSQWIATGILVIILILIMYMFFRKIKISKNIYCVGFALLLLITITIINGSLLNMFDFIFEMLNKDVTLTGRTIIWDNAINLMKSNPVKYFLVGAGYIKDGNMIPYAGGFWQAHNTLLQLICENGIVGTIIFLKFFFKAGYPVVKMKNRKLVALNVSVIFGFLIMMITEILYYYPIFIFTILLIGNSKNIFKNEKEIYRDSK